jgi:hypothetical protein
MTTVITFVLAAGCASQTPMQRRLTETRRQVEVACMKQLMDDNLPMIMYAKAMSEHCRMVARRTVRTTR